VGDRGRKLCNDHRGGGPMKIIRMTHGILLLLLVAFTGCTGPVVKFNAMPEQPYDAAKGQEIRSRACGVQLFTFIPIMLNDQAQRAYDDILFMAGGNYVTDIQVNKRWFWVLAGTVYCTELRAMEYPKIASTAPPATEETKKLSTIDECIKACKENTKRSSEECFDACKH
jgi:hypothetical protein